MRIAGAMTIHQGLQPEFADLVISDLARHVDALFILANGQPEPAYERAARACPKLAGYARVNYTYSANTAIVVGHKLHSRLFEMLEDAQPEMVLFPDADELLPPNIEEIIALLQHGDTECAENAKDTENRIPGNSPNPSSVNSDSLRELRASVLKPGRAMCVEFPVLVCAGDADHVIGNPSIHARFHAPQVTLAVWREGRFDFAPGFNYPSADYVGRGIVSPWPKRHLYVATPAAWRARYQFKPQPWMVEPWNVVSYDPERRWSEWLK